MVLVGTLWGSVRQRQTKVILSVAAMNGLQLNQPEFLFANRPAEYTEKFTYGKIPAFEGTDGLRLIEGNAIAHYLSNIGTKVDLLGSNPQEVAVVNQWVDFAEHEVGTPVGNISGTIYGYFHKFNPEIIDGNVKRLVRALSYFESHLASRASGYVALDTLTLADFVFAGAVYTASRTVLGAAERAQYPHIFAHYAKVTADERVKNYWGTDFVDIPIMEPKPFPFP